MSISVSLPHFVTWWQHRTARCLQCKRLLPEPSHGRWCSAECEDYWVQDSI
jgi:hypothetical protein